MYTIKNKISIFFLLIVVLIGNASCKDSDGTDTTNKEVNTWIENTMRENYLWYEDIPVANKLNFKNDPGTFFTSLLSDNDGKDYSSGGGHFYYSYIKDTSASANTRSISQIDYSYGFDFILYSINDTAYAARILYVASDSPASEAGLERGDWIITMGGEYITAGNYSTLDGGSAMKLHLASYSSSLNKLIYSKYVQLGTAREIEDDPVYYSNTYTYTVNGKKVGYLVYNHFTASEDEEKGDEKYNKELLALSKEFKTEGVTDFILDLRYNNGGLLTCAQLLSSILAPENVFGNTFCKLEYNDKQSPQTEELNFSSSTISSGANLDLSTVYVLVSDNTASASELVINALKPYANVVLIGTKTEGKNVGSVSYTDKKYTWKLQPIVCKLYNANSESNYVNGFSPDYTCDETETIEHWKPFGDTDELLLSTALSLIGGTYSAATVATTRSTLNLKRVACSLDRKADNAVIIR